MCGIESFRTRHTNFLFRIHFGWFDRNDLAMSNVYARKNWRLFSRLFRSLCLPNFLSLSLLLSFSPSFSPPSQHSFLRNKWKQRIASIHHEKSGWNDGFELKKKLKVKLKPTSIRKAHFVVNPLGCCLVCVAHHFLGFENLWKKVHGHQILLLRRQNRNVKMSMHVIENASMHRHVAFDLLHL